MRAATSALVGGLGVALGFLLLLVVILGGSQAVQAQSAYGRIGAPAVLRPGSIPALYEAIVVSAATTCTAITAPVLAAQIDAESGWDPAAVSGAGAEGIAQFMPGTWPTWAVDGNGNGVESPFEPADAIPAQARMMCTLYAQVVTAGLAGDPLDLALAAYNAGYGAVQSARGIPPFPETKAYVARIRALIAKYADPAGTAPGAGGPGVWLPPLRGTFPVTSGFGQRAYDLHTGIDFGAPKGTPIYAAHDGTVTTAGPVGSGYGQLVTLDNGDGLETLYGHIDAWYVQVGQPVAAGQPIAAVGNRGNVRGANGGYHLHFEIRVSGKPVDPASFYAAHGVDLTP